MKKVILFTVMLGAAIEAPIRWFRATTTNTIAPGWEWARPLTGAFLAVAVAAAIATIGGWIISRWSKTLDGVEEALVFEGISKALWILAMTIGAPAVIWWGLYLS